MGHPAPAPLPEQHQEEAPARTAVAGYIPARCGSPPCLNEVLVRADHVGPPPPCEYCAVGKGCVERHRKAIEDAKAKTAARAKQREGERLTNKALAARVLEFAKKGRPQPDERPRQRKWNPDAFTTPRRDADDE